MKVNTGAMESNSGAVMLCKIRVRIRNDMISRIVSGLNHSGFTTVDGRPRILAVVGINSISHRSGQLTHLEWLPRYPISWSFFLYSKQRLWLYIYEREVGWSILTAPKKRVFFTSCGGGLFFLLRSCLFESH